jgi:PAS domain S-box-containing protein
MRQSTRRTAVPSARGASRGASEERLRLLLDSLPDAAIFMVGPQGMVLTWNEGATRIFGHRPQEIIGQRFSQLYPPNAIADGEPPRDLDLARSAERHESEGWRLRKDGSAFWASVVVTELRDREGRPRGFGVVVRELTDRRRADDLLAVLDAAVDPMLGFDDDGRVIFANTAAQHAFGYPPNEIVGLPLERLLPDMVREPEAGAGVSGVDASSPEVSREPGASADASRLPASPLLPGPRVPREQEWREPKLTVSGLELDAVRRDGSTFLARVSLAAVRTVRGGVVTATVRELPPSAVTGRRERGPGPASNGCDVCGARVAFENVRCLNCGSPLGFSLSARRVVVLRPDAHGQPEYRTEAGGPVEHPCANQVFAECNWLAPEGAANGLCLSCRLTRTRPKDDDTAAHGPYVRAEAAKRRLVGQLLDLGLPVVPWRDDPDGGLAVDLLPGDRPVVTGHADGVIPLDRAEGDDPHRTVLGRLRHESGHYYWELLVGGRDQIDGFRALFGDERLDHQQAVDRHDREGPPAGWAQDHVSAYATAHPWEDWAETFAHYLHLRDLLQTAQAFGLTGRRPVEDGSGFDTLDDVDMVAAEGSVADLVNRWLPLRDGLNAISRSMGTPDLYPFVLTPPVIAKLDVVHRAVQRAAAARHT